MRARTRRALTLSIAALACLLVLPAAALAIGDPPQNLNAPELTGDPIVGSELFVSDGVWSGDEPLTYTYDWESCDATLTTCSEISGANGSALSVTDDLAGKRIRAWVTATDFEEEPESAESNATSEIVMPNGIIGNGTVRIGLNPYAAMNVDGGPQSSGGESITGLRLVDGEFEAVSPGSPAEGWGVADAGTGVFAKGNRDQGGATNLVPFDIDYTNSTMTSVHTVEDGVGDPYMRVTHDFEPSLVSPNLYRVEITVEPLQPGGIQDLRYRRNVDWDTEPTPFQEFVTNVPGDSSNITYVGDEGFVSSSPLDATDFNMFEGEGYDRGPTDHGAMFDFDFGALAFGATKTFVMYYGAAPSQSAMMDALKDVDAEAYSIAKPSSFGGPQTGEPATFALAFSDIGGDPAFDDTAPKASITSGPGMTGGTNVTFEFEVDQLGATTECQLDGEPFSACTSPISYNSLGEGYHTFVVRASKDGNTQAPPTVATFLVDLTPPDLYFDETPFWWTTTDDAYFEIEDDDGPTDDLVLECSLDGGAFAPCDPELELIDLAPGPHKLKVQGTDSSGNVATPISYSWTISDELNTRFLQKPKDSTRSTTAYFEWQGSSGASEYECSLDGAAFSSCNYDIELQGLTEGQHTFAVRSVDPADNVDATPATHQWTIDRGGPTLTIDSDLSVPLVATGPGLLFHSSEEGTFKCNLDGQGWYDCESPYSLAALANGEHTISVRAFDLAGNGSETANLKFTVAFGTSAPLIGKLPAPKKGKASVPYTCNSTACTLSATVKLGKKKFKLKGKTVPQGSGKASLTFGKSLKKQLAKKNRKKATLTVTLTGEGQPATVKKKF